MAIKISMASKGRHWRSWGKKPKMMKRRFAVTTDQQAPSVFWQAAPSAIQRLSNSAQRTKGGTVFHSKYTTIIVKRELNQPLNRFVRIQPITPTDVIGGLIASVSFVICVLLCIVSMFGFQVSGFGFKCSDSARLTPFLLSFHKHHFFIIPVHQGRRQ